MKDKGFTLMELMIVIIGILSAVGIIITKEIGANPIL